MKPGRRIEILIALNNDARWHDGTIIEPSVRHPKCWNVRLDDGRRFDGCHPDSMRVIVSEAAMPAIEAFTLGTSGASGNPVRR